MNTAVILLFSKKWVPGSVAEDNSGLNTVECVGVGPLAADQVKPVYCLMDINSYSASHDN